MSCSPVCPPDGGAGLGWGQVPAGNKYSTGGTTKCQHCERWQRTHGYGTLEEKVNGKAR